MARWLVLLLLLSFKLSIVTACSCQSHGGCQWSDSVSQNVRSHKANAAMGKPVKMSSVYKTPREASGPACLANDGRNDRNLVLIGGSSPPTCVKSGLGDANPFWEVDLKAPYYILNVTIYWDQNVTDAVHAGVKVDVSDNVIATVRTPIEHPSHFVCNQEGQYVKLYKLGDERGDKYFLSICEVQAWVCFPGYYGETCERICSKQICSNETRMPCHGGSGNCEDIRGQVIKTETESDKPAASPAQPAAQPATQPATSGKSQSKCRNPMIAGIIVTVCFLLGLGIFALLWFSGKSPPPQTMATEPKREKSAEVGEDVTSEFSSQLTTELTSKKSV